MKHKILFFLLPVLFFIGGCSDPELDPIQFDNVKKATILGLRDYSYNRIASSTLSPLFLTGVDTFNVLQDNSSKVFSFVCDFISEDQNSLGSVDVYVVNKAKARVKVKSIPASEFKSGVAGTNFKRATISIPFPELFNAAGKDLCEYKPSNAKLGVYSFIDIENDINLTDGSIIPASSVVNSSLFESVIFYPAHKMRLIARGPAIENFKVDLPDGKKLNVNFDNLLTQKVSGMTYTWVTDGNTLVDGISATGNSNLLADVLKKSVDKKQTVVYTVTPKLPNGCEGSPFTVTVNVINKVPCPSKMAGSYLATATGTSTDTCCPEETTINDIPITITEVPNSEGVYVISDWSGGLYLKWYAAYGITAATNMSTEITEDCGDVILTNKDYKEPFDESLTIEGKWDEAKGTLTFTWVNGYNDKAVVTLKKQ